ncbi:oxygen-dependent coproporphyrinogen oxidase [cf. Phormidesmis sp. LEGE 11477]|uniref:oxygen-dependent coproporphyrinogen oxidase n=1 Tax=cf. Phormidesmis sp. LEGE 11477 TaxID=1828680 RepID=UPI0018802E7E|nr:oxygen-dependent coproporphyrinogen oxidase [cf. Phormidesmis sp. LEGE 11477]MBE9060627.1 oxygen-dependent coproporphyrinogen oxidase [cf. Phormidesmis sp. LEGE 11477]
MPQALEQTQKHETFLKKTEAVFKHMFDHTCGSIEQLDGQLFSEQRWARDNGNWVTGENSSDAIYIDRSLQNGSVFEKIGVNFVAINGELPPGVTFQKAGALTTKEADKEENKAGTPFFATGTSFVIHPYNPMVPIAHCNYRYFQIGKRDQPQYWWFGGGADLTPAYLFEEDAKHFHQTHKQVCDQHDTTYYPRFKQWCDQYFHISHRGESRGVGGIFFDQLNDLSAEELLEFVEACTKAFPQAYLPIVARRKDADFTDTNKQWQRLVRGRYVEFILTSDRGARFGLASGMVTPQSVFNCMPPAAAWTYDDQPASGSAEAALKQVLQQPRAWV